MYDTPCLFLLNLTELVTEDLISTYEKLTTKASPYDTQIRIYMSSSTQSRHHHIL
jgi:hypothetical protein